MNKNGSILICVLLTLIFAALTSTIMLRSVNENKIVKRRSASTEAFWTAEAGVQNTLWEINHNACANFLQTGTSTHCVSCSSCGAGTKTLSLSIPNSCDFDAVIDSGNTTLTSTGSCPSRSSAQRVQRNVQTSIGTTSPFTYAAFAKGQVTLQNNTYIDSYNSNNGAYNVATNSNTNGDVGSNGTTAGIITLGNNMSLGGDVSTGIAGTVVQGSGTAVSGTVSHTNNISLPDVVVPTALTSLASGGVYSVSGTRTLAVGDYQYTSMSFSNNATLNITGTTRIYLTGAASLSSGNNVTVNIPAGATLQLFVNGVLAIPNNVTLTSSGNVPKNLQIYSTYTGVNGIDIKNNGLLATAVYAPQTNIYVKNNDVVYGSLIGKTVQVDNNSAIHYDETLSTLSTPTGATGFTSWKEI